MSDILEQIQELNNMFNNLFEVEGLGDPAVDVPPSQNKIKRERKTKDGKVELVSVEDELFPYEGDKKQQFQQKVIATINDMIQGTATLEDLLQLVRRKNAPLKEAMELMEAIINEVSDKTAQSALDAAQQRYNRKGYEASMKLFQGDSKGAIEDGNKAQDEYNKHINLQLKRAKRLGKKLVQDKNDHDSFKIEEAASCSAENSLKEAMEILEAIKDEVKNHHKFHGGSATFSYKGNNYSYTPEKGLKKGGKTRDDRNTIKQIVDTENKEFDDVRKYKYDLERQSRAIGKKLNKEVKKLEKTEGKGAFPRKTNDTIKKLLATATTNSSNRADADKYFAEVNAKQKKLMNDAKGIKYEAKDFYNTKKGDNFHIKPVVKTSEALEESFEISEKIEKYTDEEGNNHELEFSCSKDNKENKYKFDHRINGKSVVSAHDSIPNDNYERKHAIKNYGLKKVEEALNVLLEGRKEGESQEDFKHRLHHELVRAIDKKAEEARDKSIEASKKYHETGKGKEEAIKASEKYKKEHDKLDKLDTIEPVFNAYATEALEEALKILEGLFIDDSRGDILDDITGTKMTGIQRIRKGVQKIVGTKKKSK